MIVGTVEWFEHRLAVARRETDRLLDQWDRARHLAGVAQAEYNQAARDEREALEALRSARGLLDS
jgi:hypothetical protein